MIHGYRRSTGALGARNHILVLPSVVCSGLTAQQIAGDDAVAITHQHGCAVVGDDVEHTAAVFSGVAGNPNVGGVLVVGLGCETIQGAGVARRISAAGQRVSYVGVQAEGGTGRTIDRGREALARLHADAKCDRRESAPTRSLAIGVDDADAPFVDELQRLAESAGARVVEAAGARGAEAHPELAGAGAQVIVAWCGLGEGPRGFAICPVISVGSDPELCDALAADYDLAVAGDDSPEEIAGCLWHMALRVFDGEQTAAEIRGADDFYLRRLARSM